MPALAPFLLRPVFKARPWGARDLAPIFDKKADAEPIGEAWLTGDECQIVGGGPLEGMTLGEATKRFGAELVGEHAPQNGRFPLLIKFLFPREKLSVQVHPDDEGARKLGQPCGKTECWYVLLAEPGAQVGLGLKPGVTRDDFARAITEKRAEQLMNWLDIHAGEMIYVPAGTVHAIGPGSVLVETQQNSDTTFRLYDYGRPRELHVEQGLAAMKVETGAGKVKPRVNGGLTTLVHSPCFKVQRITLESGTSVEQLGAGFAVGVIVLLQGAAGIQGEGAYFYCGAGDAVVIPAEGRSYQVTATAKGRCEMLLATPGATATQPETHGVGDIVVTDAGKATLGG